MVPSWFPFHHPPTFAQASVFVLLCFGVVVIVPIVLDVIVTVTPQLPATQLPSSASADSASAEVGNYWVQVFPHFFC